MERKPTREEVEAWLKGTGVVRNANDYPVEGTEWYVVPMDFLQSWKENNSGAELKIDHTPLLVQPETALNLPSEHIIKPDFILGADYEVVPPAAWQYFKSNFPVISNREVLRHSIAIEEGITQIEVTYKALNLMILGKTGKFQSKSPSILYVPHKSTITEISKKLIKILIAKKKLSISTGPDQIRIWKIEPTFSLAYLLEKEPLVMQTFPGTILQGNLKLDEAQVADEDTLLVELKATVQLWNLEQANFIEPGSCKSCFRKFLYGLACPCKLRVYCNQKCMKGDRAHNCRPNTNQPRVQHLNAYQTPAKPQPLTPLEGSIRGKVGLQNIGNTCYMNSGLQCLANTTFLIEFILSGQYRADINTTNPLGSGGKLVEEFAELIRGIWYGTSRVFAPWAFKTELNKFARQFAGYNQHDGQELLTFVIDGLHEDLNRIRDKPYIEEIVGHSEEELYEQSWEAHLLRNQSVISEKMHGLYRSEVVCPICSTKSLTFDPFSMVTLQIPEVKDAKIPVSYIPLQGAPKMLEVHVSSNCPMKEVKDTVGAQVKAYDLVLVNVTNKSYFDRTYTDNDLFTKTANLHAYELPLLTESELGIIVEFFSEPITGASSTFFVKTSLSFPRILQMHRSTTLREIYSLLSKNFSKNEELSVNFPRFFGQAGPNLFKLNFVNPTKKRFLNSGNIECPYCNTRQCLNCEVPFTDESIGSYFERLQQIIKIELILSKTETAPPEFGYIEPVNPSPADSHHSGVLNIYKCLAASSHPEKLDEQNSTFCKKCNLHVTATKKLEVQRLPEYLVFHLKRFKGFGYIGVKNSQLVEFPLAGLDMGRFCLTEGGVYDLYAVTNHFGTHGYGHYTAFAKNYVDTQWYEFDDARVSQVNNLEKICSPAAYVLFYKKRTN